VRFTTTLWRSIEPIYATILAHPFLRGLTDGGLPREAFRFYAVQDALYLRDFARALLTGAFVVLAIMSSSIASFDPVSDP